MAILHIFEQAGLGTAPFRYVDYFEKKGGFCDYCSHPITRHYGVQGTDGRTFYVGSECIFKHGDEGLIDTVKAKIREVDRERRRAKAEAKAAIKRAEKMAQEAEWRARLDKVNAIVDGKRAELIPQIQAATAWLTDVLDKHTRSNFCQELSCEIQVSFRTLSSRGYNRSRVLPILKDIWAKDHGRGNSKAYLAAEDEFDRRVEETDIIISDLNDQLNATAMAARVAA